MTRCLSFFSLLSLLVLLVFPARAQVLTPTVLTTALSQPTAKVGTELDLIITAKIQTGWHLYATDFSDEVGPAVFNLTFAKSPAYALVGKPKSIGSKHVHDDVFNGEVAFFEATGLVRQRIKLLKAGPLTIKAEAEYQSCSGTDGRCVPGSTSLSFGPLRVAAKATAAVVPVAGPTPRQGGTSQAALA